MLDQMSENVRDIDYRKNRQNRQIDSQVKCQIECRGKCQSICQTGCQIQCQTICQIECQIRCQTDFQILVKCERGCQITCQSNLCEVKCQRTCYRRKFRSQTSDIMDRWKAEQGRGREKRKIRREKSRRERVRRKKMQMREKVGKSRNTVFLQWFAPEGRKVGSLKRRVRSQLARWEMKNCTPLWREAHFEVKMYKTHHCRTTFGSWDVEKVHAVVARSTFRSQNVQNTPLSDHFWKLRCRKSARRCVAKHISKSKCTKHTIVGPLLEVEMWKKCTPLWREAHFQVKMYKTLHVRATFGGSDVEKVHAVVARSTFRSQNVKKHQGFGPLLEVQMSRRFTAIHYTTLHSTTLHCTTLHYTTLQLQLHNYTTTLHYTPLHSTTLH